MKRAAHVTFAVLIGLSLSGLAQSRSKEELASLFAEVANDEKATVACMKMIREEQIEKFGKPLPRLSGHCYEGCPTRVPKPYYPETARRNRISGKVVVNAIVDEMGKVIYAKTVIGNGLLRPAATEAAYQATYQPKTICEGRPIKFRWRIEYYFHPKM